MEKKKWKNEKCHYYNGIKKKQQQHGNETMTESEKERMFQTKLFCRGHRDPPVDGVTGGSRKNCTTLM